MAACRSIKRRAGRRPTLKRRAEGTKGAEAPSSWLVGGRGGVPSGGVSPGAVSSGGVPPDQASGWASPDVAGWQAWRRAVRRRAAGRRVVRPCCPIKRRAEGTKGAEAPSPWRVGRCGGVPLDQASGWASPDVAGWQAWRVGRRGGVPSGGVSPGAVSSARVARGWRSGAEATRAYGVFPAWLHPGLGTF